MLHGDCWSIVFDVSVQTIRPIFKDRSPRVVNRHQRFGGACCIHLQVRMYHFAPKDEDTRFLLNVGADLSNYTASRPRKQ